MSTWLIVLAGPLAWAAHLVGSYRLVYWVCQGGHPGVLHVLTAVTLLVAATGAWAGWAAWRRPVAVGSLDTDPSDPPRRRQLAGAGVVLDLLFMAVILAQGLPTVILEACG